MRKKSQLNSSSVVESEKRKRKKCDCYMGSCGQCHAGWYFAPFYGPGDGTSGAATGGGFANVPSGANPGPGGINAPGIPSGPNSGMGPVAASREITGHSLFNEVQSLYLKAKAGTV